MDNKGFYKTALIDLKNECEGIEAKWSGEENDIKEENYHIAHEISQKVDEIIDLNLARFIKYDTHIEIENPIAYWVNSYNEDRKGSMASCWALSKEKPTDKKVRFYPACTKDYFIESVLPKLLTK